MPKQKVRVVHNPETDRLLEAIRADQLFLDELGENALEGWTVVENALGADASARMTSANLVPAMTDLLIEFVQAKVKQLNEIPGKQDAAKWLDAISRKAALYLVVDSLLQDFLPDRYIPMSDHPSVEIVYNQSDDTPLATGSQGSLSVILFALMLCTLTGFLIR